MNSNNTTELTLMPIDIVIIKKIMEDNDINSQITLTKSEGFGIGSVLEMSWDTDHNGYNARITVEVCGVEDW